MLAVEAAMRWYAERLDGDAESWGLAGLLHDFDWEIHPTLEQHPADGAAILRERGLDEGVIQTILSHNTDGTGVERETSRDYALLACDEITGLISAAALIRPSKDVRDVPLKSVRKRWKQRAFAGRRRPRARRRGHRRLQPRVLRRRTRTLAARRQRAGGDAGRRRGTRAGRPPGEVIFPVLFALLAGATAAQQHTARPNVLWIDIDDQSPWYSSYGHDLVDTPNIDALARQGVLFERAYAPTPVCSPTRSSLITGSYAIRIGAHDHRSGRVPGYRIHLPEGVVTVPELFRAAGYETYNASKDDFNFTYDRTKLYTIGAESSEIPSWKGPSGSRTLARRVGRQAVLRAHEGGRRQGRREHRRGSEGARPCGP